MKVICYVDDQIQTIERLVRSMSSYLKNEQIENTMFKVVGVLDEEAQLFTEDIEYSERRIKDVLKEINGCTGESKEQDFTFLNLKNFSIDDTMNRSEREVIYQNIMKYIKNEICLSYAEDTLFMIDMNLQKKDSENLMSNRECLSMGIYREAIKNNKCRIYSNYVGDIIKARWEQTYENLYGEDVPNISEREELVGANFSIREGRRIVNELWRNEETERED